MLVGGVLAVYAWRWMSPADTEAPDDVLDMVDRAMMKVASAAGAWYPPEPYNDWIAATEEHYGLPENLLARLLYQECRYREDIISGAVRSPAGALGIAQFMPATARDLGIDPLDPSQAIDCGWSTAKLRRKVPPATGSASTAAATSHPAARNPSERPPAPAKRSTTLTG
jgi:soluble lytic murein transglycosylase-like protein